MENDLFETLNIVLSTLYQSDKLSFKNNNLFSFVGKKILTPAGDVTPLLHSQKSKFKDEFADFGLLKKLIDSLIETKSIIRLNHIGFCYKVDSQKVERERLIKSVNNSKFHLYEEPSNDEGKWYFIGNTDNWENPMIEMVPIERTNDQWSDYWLPHIQIDIDTNLTEGEIEKLVKSTFGKSVIPFPISIEGVVYIVRNRLGIIDGVNIMLDLATNSRNVKHTRQNILKKVQ